VTVANTGTFPLTIQSVRVAGTDAAEFVRTRHCPATLVPQTNCTVDVVFKPASAGAKSARLVVSTAESGRKAVPLSGSGL
jgi:hypothetical protein